MHLTVWSNISSNSSFVGMRITLYKFDILSSERHFQSFSEVYIIDQQFVFSVCFTSILNHSKQANDNDGFSVRCRC